MTAMQQASKESKQQHMLPRAASQQALNQREVRMSHRAEASAFTAAAETRKLELACMCCGGANLGGKTVMDEAARSNELTNQNRSSKQPWDHMVN